MKNVTNVNTNIEKEIVFTYQCIARTVLELGEIDEVIFVDENAFGELDQRIGSGILRDHLIQKAKTNQP